ENQNAAPQIVAVFLQEGAFGAVDKGGRSLMRGQGGSLVGVPLLDFRRTQQFPGERLPNGEELPGEGADGGFGQGLWRDNQMVDADRIDLVLGPCGRRAERAAGNLLGFIE